MSAECLSRSAMVAADQFEYWWQLQGEWVEEPNRRRGGESGVQRLHDLQGQLLYAKRQVGHLCRSLAHPFGRPTVLRERDALLSLGRLGVRVPRVVYCAASYVKALGWRGVLVSEALDGFTDIDSWYAAGGRERYAAQHVQLLQQIGATLARMHLGRWQHGCLYAKHVFVKVTAEGAEVALLDLEKSRRRLSRKRAALHDMLQLRRHSSWSDAEWQQVIYGYERVFGNSFKELLK